MTRRVTLLWHDQRPVGICVFAAPAASLRLRNDYFGLSGHRRSAIGNRPEKTLAGTRSSRLADSRRPIADRRLQLKQLNRQLWLLSRVVLHPTYRGAGVAAAFVRRSCETCPIPWIETLTAMGHLNPFFEKAGFQRVGVIRKDGGGLSARAYGGIYGGRARITAETVRKSRYAEPVYYVFDNRGNATGERGQTRAE